MPSYDQRTQLVANPTAKKLLEIMIKKKTNLALSLDVTSKKKFLQIAEKLAPEICLLKTHIDIIEDFDEDLLQQLTAMAKQYHFLIFEDRKFADIGNTVKLQYSKGIYHIADWAHLTNAHAIVGEGVIQGLKEIGLSRGNALLLVAQLSAKGNLMDQQYIETTIKFAKKHADFVIGFIAQNKLINDPAFLHLCPGVNLTTTHDALGQQYKSPQQAIRDGNDIIIVGRGIYEAKDPLAEARAYREAGWVAMAMEQPRQES